MIKMYETVSLLCNGLAGMIESKHDNKSVIGDFDITIIVSSACDF